MSRVIIWARVPFEDAYTEVGGVVAPTLMQAYEEARVFASWLGLSSERIYVIEHDGPGWASMTVSPGDVWENCTFAERAP